MRFAVYLEKEPDSDYGVTVPDLPGCFSAGETIDSALAHTRESILTHIEGMLMDNEEIPLPAALEEHRERCSGKNIIWALVEVDLSSLSDRAKRINITLPEKVLTKIDAAAKREGESRSGFLAEAALEYITRHSSKNH